MTHALPRMLAGACKAVIAWLLLALLCLAPVAPAFAMGPADKGSPGQASERSTPANTPGRAVREGDSKQQAEGPRNPYDMKALRQFDAGSHRAEQPRSETTQPPEGSGS